MADGSGKSFAEQVQSALKAVSEVKGLAFHSLLSSERVKAALDVSGVNLRSIKCSLGMKQLNCKTPDMVQKELWMYLLVYNLLRERMAQAAARHQQQPRWVSFQSSKTLILAFIPALKRATTELREALEQELQRCMARCQVGDRPGRKEPRAVKKRE